MTKDRGCKAFPYRLTCKEGVTWHETKECCHIYIKREQLHGCCVEVLKGEEYEGVE